MNTITVTYDLKWRLSFATHYQFTDDGKCFNIQTNRQIKQVLNGRCIGYCIKGKFYSATYLRLKLEKIPKENKFPF